MRVTLRKMADGDYHQLHLSSVKISQSEHGGEDPDTFFVVRIEYTDEWGDDFKGGKYHATICACGPGWPAGEDPFSSIGMSREEFNALPLDGQLGVLIVCGLHAPLWQESGNNLEQLKRMARCELQKIGIFAGFYLDRPVNAIGNSGWDFMRGEYGLSRC